LSVASAVTLNGHRIFLFLYNFKVNSGNVRFICLAAQTLAEEQSIVKVFFITQIGHRPRASDSKQGLKKETGHIMTILELQYNADAKKLYLKLTRNRFCIFFPANNIVSYREFISSPPHVRLKQLCPTHGPVESLCGPFSVLAAVISILHTDNHFLFW